MGFIRGSRNQINRRDSFLGRGLSDNGFADEKCDRLTVQISENTRGFFRAGVADASPPLPPPPQPAKERAIRLTKRLRAMIDGFIFHSSVMFNHTRQEGYVG